MASPSDKSALRQRVEQAEVAAIDLEYRLGVLRREVRVLRAMLDGDPSTPAPARPRAGQARQRYRSRVKLAMTRAATALGFPRSSS